MHAQSRRRFLDEYGTFFRRSLRKSIHGALAPAMNRIMGCIQTGASVKSLSNCRRSFSESSFRKEATLSVVTCAFPRYRSASKTSPLVLPAAAILRVEAFEREIVWFPTFTFLGDASVKYVILAGTCSESRSKLAA